MFVSTFEEIVYNRDTVMLLLGLLDPQDTRQMKSKRLKRRIYRCKVCCHSTITAHYEVDLIVQVNKKFRELKGGNIGIVEKAQETRFGMSFSMYA